MTRRIFFSIFLSGFLLALTCTSLIMLVTYEEFNEKEVDKMWIQNNFMSKAVESLGINYLESVSTQEYRITWISAQGDVLFDTHSDIEMMENHSDRPEIIEAIQTGYGWNSRESETMMLQQVYTALRLEDGSILRISDEQDTFFAFILSMLKPLLLGLLLSAILSNCLAKYLSKEIIKPLHQLDLNNPSENVKAYEEITPLLVQIKKQYQENDRQLIELTRKKVEFELITRDMAEGLIILGSGGEIFSINQSAGKLFGIIKENCIGKNFLTVYRGKELSDILHAALEGTHSEGMLPLGGHLYQVSASPMLEENTVTGVVVLLFDVTQQSETEQIRREFTANVSHELKTPLHTISGCAELMSHNLVQEKDIPQFSQQIYKEAQRLIRLVEEIISLSKLDEGVELDMHEEVDLYSIGKEITEKLTDMAKNNNVTLTFQGETAKLRGSYTLLSGVMHNLCENAIKYNRPFGTVDISVKSKGNTLCLQVEDSGIGISEKDQNLIFQRFYRVDKSRSKEIGGTGLGLSIVKHAVCLHNGRISIKSALSVGTCITVEFPNTFLK